MNAPDLITTSAAGYPRRLDLAAIAGREPPPRTWIVEGMIPRSANVLFSAHGGAGKTLLALQLAVCIAAGRPFFGLPTTQATVVALFAEDDHDELHRRLAAVCTALDVNLADIADRLLIFDAVGVDVGLFSRRAAGDDGRQYATAEPDTTPMYDWARFVCTTAEAEVLLLDSISDTFDAEENRRAQVRRYLTRCLDLVLPRRGAVIQVAHVDKAAARSGVTGGQSFSGSTAWHNSCRSRVALRSLRPDEGGGQQAGDDGRRELVVEKLNYGKPGLTIPLRYDVDRHVFVRDGDAGDGGMVGAIRERTECRGVIKALLEAAAAGRSVSTARQANNNAGAILAPLASLPSGLKSQTGRRRLVSILLDLEAAGMIEREVYTTPTRNQSERWRVTSAGQVEAE